MTAPVIIFLLIVGYFDPTIAICLFVAHLIYLGKKKRDERKDDNYPPLE